MLEIIFAEYGNKDVTSVLKSKVVNDKLIVGVNNSNFGDPKPGVVKTLLVKYVEDDDEKKMTLTEGEILILPFTKSSKLGIFYTNNRIPHQILIQSLNSIKKASEKHNVDIITSVWEHIPDNPFFEVMCPVRTGNHFNIAYQICQLLLTAQSSKRYETVSYLEHDVLYGEDYFDFEPFDGNVICNHNYMGICKHGFQNKGQGDEPLHQLTLKFDFAFNHFRNTLMESIVRGVNLEPLHSPAYLRREAKQPSIHINHGHHFTSHFNIYQKKYYPEHPYWGKADNIIKNCNL